MTKFLILKHWCNAFLYASKDGQSPSLFPCIADAAPGKLLNRRMRASKQIPPQSYFSSANSFSSFYHFRLTTTPYEDTKPCQLNSPRKCLPNPGFFNISLPTFNEACLYGCYLPEKHFVPYLPEQCCCSLPDRRYYWTTTGPKVL